MKQDGSNMNTQGWHSLKLGPPPSPTRSKGQSKHTLAIGKSVSVFLDEWFGRNLLSKIPHPSPASYETEGHSKTELATMNKRRQRGKQLVGDMLDSEC